MNATTLLLIKVLIISGGVFYASHRCQGDRSHPYTAASTFHYRIVYHNRTTQKYSYDYIWTSGSQADVTPSGRQGYYRRLIITEDGRRHEYENQQPYDWQQTTLHGAYRRRTNYGPNNLVDFSVVYNSGRTTSAIDWRPKNGYYGRHLELIVDCQSIDQSGNSLVGPPHSTRNTVDLGQYGQGLGASPGRLTLSPSWNSYRVRHSGGWYHLNMVYLLNRTALDDYFL